MTIEHKKGTLKEIKHIDLIGLPWSDQLAKIKKHYKVTDSENWCKCVISEEVIYINDNWYELIGQDLPDNKSVIDSCQSEGDKIAFECSWILGLSCLELQLKKLLNAL